MFYSITASSKQCKYLATCTLCAGDPLACCTDMVDGKDDALVRFLDGDSGCSDVYPRESMCLWYSQHPRMLCDATVIAREFMQGSAEPTFRKPDPHI